MTVTCTGYFLGDYLCYRCLQGTGLGAFILVEDGDTADEQYVCEACAREVAGGAELGRLRMDAVPEIAH
jgi:hypothetical protein